MADEKLVLALDQGTTSCRAILFSQAGRIVASAQQEFTQILPAPGLVEHDANEIWRTQLAVAQQAMEHADISPDRIAAIGITNQRETTVLWDRRTGKPVANAIVWQSRVTAPYCEQLKAEGYEPLFRERTGLVVDAYFSGTKIRHLLQSDSSLRAAAERGDILFGTIDSWLVWNLTGGKLHITDVSNASRTLLFNLHTLDWDDELLEILDVPRAMLPQVVPSSEVYGHCLPELFGKPLPISGMAGDQQAATFGQACFTAGDAKNTYGTGCFLLMNTGNKPVVSQHGLLSTIGWQINGQTTYCLEGAVFIAGAAVQWLRDGLGIIAQSSDVEPLADSVPDTQGVYFVPALVGLGAPYWDPQARGTIVGITRGTAAAHIARAALDAMAYQTHDLVTAMQQDSGIPLQSLRVDGGASVNDRLMQFQADMLNVPVRRPVVSETTALGAAYLAGLAVGVWQGLNEVTNNWAIDREFTPQMKTETRDRLYRNWQRAVERSRNWATDEHSESNPLSC